MQAIVFNYAFCVMTGSVVLGHFPLKIDLIHEAYAGWAVLMGLLFISVFNLVGFSSVKVGITITQTANKLSLVIPVIFSYMLYQEQIGWIKILGILIALGAVVMLSVKPASFVKVKIPLWEYMLPLILFISSGIIDTLTKYVQQRFLTSTAISNTYLISGFFTAFVIGAFALSYQYIAGKRVFQLRNVVAGMILGIPNYFSIFYLVKALESNVLSSSAIIPINNIAVLFVVSLFGIFIFMEKLSKVNYAGLLLTLIAILLIVYGDQI
jgi:drug/metabolite transporter (DMT)-like permease